MAVLQLDDLVAIWGSVIDEVSVESPQYRAFLALTKPLGLLEGDGAANLLLSAPNDFAKDVLETRLRSTLSDVLSAKLNQPINIAVTVVEDKATAEEIASTIL